MTYYFAFCKEALLLKRCADGTYTIPMGEQPPTGVKPWTQMLNPGPLDGHEVAYRCRLLCDMAALTGCTMKAPFITMAFMCLPVIPELKITDKHLWDSKNMKVIED